MKTLKIIVMALVVLSLLLGLVIIVKRKAIFQEGNPVPIFIAMAKLTFGNEPYVKISGVNERYLLNFDSPYQTKLVHEMNCVEEQFGSAYKLTCVNGQKKWALVRTYCHFFEIWNIYISKE